MDLEQFDKKYEEVRGVLAHLPPEAHVLSLHLSGPVKSSVNVLLPHTAEAYGVVASLCGLFGTPEIDHQHLVFLATPIVEVRARGDIRRFTSIPTSAQFVMPEDAA